MTDHAPGADPFAGIDPSVRDDLVRTGERFELAASELLFAQGGAADHAYLVLEGRLEVSARLPGDEITVVGEIGPGEVIGEFALLLHDRPRATRVRAVEPSGGIRIVRDRFVHLMADGWGPAIALLDGLCRLNAARIRHAMARIGGDAPFEATALRCAGDGPAPVSLAADTSPPDLAHVPLGPALRPEAAALAAQGHWLQVARGGRIAAPGEAADHLLLVARGAVRAGLPLAGGLAPVALHGPGELVGATPLIDGGLRVMWLEAAEDAVLLAIARDRFAELRQCTTTLGRALLFETGRQLANDLQRINRHLARIAVLERLQAGG